MWLKLPFPCDDWPKSIRKEHCDPVWGELSSRTTVQQMKGVRAEEIPNYYSE